MPDDHLPADRPAPLPVPDRNHGGHGEPGEPGSPGRAGSEGHGGAGGAGGRGGAGGFGWPGGAGGKGGRGGRGGKWLLAGMMPGAYGLKSALLLTAVIVHALLAVTLVWHLYIRPQSLAFVAIGSPKPAPALRATSRSAGNGPPVIEAGSHMVFERRLLVREPVLGQRLVVWHCDGAEYGRRSDLVGYLPRNGRPVVTEYIDLEVPGAVPDGPCSLEISMVLDRPPLRKDVIVTPSLEVLIGPAPRP